MTARVFLIIIAGALLIGCGLLWANSRKFKESLNEGDQQVASSGAPAGLGGQRPNVKEALKGIVNPEKLLSSAKEADKKPGAEGATAPLSIATRGSEPSQGQESANLSQEGAASEKGTSEEGQGQALKASTMPIPGQKNIAATSRMDAIALAKTGGQIDPFQPVPAYKDFPRVKTTVTAGVHAPPPLKEAELVPPPPATPAPTAEGYPLDSGVSAAELPPPPDKPLISEKMKLLAILGDKVVLTQGDSKAKTVTLGPGDHFESVSVVQVDPTSVTLEEDGERSVKALPAIR